MLSDEAGALLDKSEKRRPKEGLKKKPSFYGIRSHLKKFYEISFSAESDQSSPPPMSDESNPSSTKKKCCNINVIRCICRFCVLVGSISILVGISLLVAVFSAPFEAPILKNMTNSKYEGINVVKLNYNHKLESLQTVGIYLLLGGSSMLLAATVIAIVYLIILSCCHGDNNNNEQDNGHRGHRPYVYDGGDY